MSAVYGSAEYVYSQLLWFCDLECLDDTEVGVLRSHRVCWSALEESEVVVVLFHQMVHSLHCYHVLHAYKEQGTNNQTIESL